MKLDQKESKTTPLNRSPLPKLSRSSSVSSETLPGDEDPDTIVVDVSDRRLQLPTPAESTVDVFSESSHDVNLRHVSRGITRCVGVWGDPKEQSHDWVVQTGTLRDVGRNVSGETLVTNTSRSSILRNGIAALDLPWSVTSLVQRIHTGVAGESTPISETSAPNDDGGEARLRSGKAAARKVKMEENRRIWEARRKAADAKAIRRSSRRSMLEKAGETVAGLTASVLGKRSREVLVESKDRLGRVKRLASLRSRSIIEPVPSSAAVFERPLAKHRRLSDSHLIGVSRPIQASSILKDPVPIRKDKRWLDSGLYTGQTKDFDGRLSKSKNRRKYDAAPTVKENNTLPLPMFAGERIMKYGRDFKLPYDVFSPLPPGQPRPDEWRRTNKNVFVGDAAQVWRHSKPREHSTCMCTQAKGCDDHCMNRFMFYECDNGNCKLAECSNRSFQSLAQRSKKGGKYNVGVEVIQTQDRGFGVRSNRTFEPNQIIVEYTGEIITQDECDKRMRTLYKNNECYYLMSFDQNMIIDATRGSIARFVNHSCEPNCRMEKWTVGGKPRMALFAGDKGIMTGDELTYDYNFDPFSQKNIQECRCRSSKCRGVLGPKPKEERKLKDLGTSTASRLGGAKRKIIDILDEGSRWNKRRRIAVPASAVSAFKSITTSNTRSKTPPQPHVASSTSSGPARPVNRASLIDEPTVRMPSLSTGAPVAGRPSRVKRFVSPASAKACTRRTVSRPSLLGALVHSNIQQEMSRKGSVKAKAASIRRNVLRSVRGSKAV